MTSYNASASIRSANCPSTGTISGGSETIRRRPSTTTVSFASAFVLSRVRALASRSSVFLYRPALSCDLNCRIDSSMSRCAYQTLSKGMSATSRIAVRYVATADSAAVVGPENRSPPCLSPLDWEKPWRTHAARSSAPEPPKTASRGRVGSDLRTALELEDGRGLPGMSGLGHVDEPGVVALERDSDRGRGAVAVLGQDDVGLAGTRRLTFVRILAVQQQHHVGILFDRT